MNDEKDEVIKSLSIQLEKLEIRVTDRNKAESDIVQKKL